MIILHDAVISLLIKKTERAKQKTEVKYQMHMEKRKAMRRVILLLNHQNHLMLSTLGLLVVSKDKIHAYTTCIPEIIYSNYFSYLWDTQFSSTITTMPLIVFLSGRWQKKCSYIWTSRPKYFSHKAKCEVDKRFVGGPF